MKNLKLYFYGFIVLFFISAVVTSNILIKKNKALKAENERVQNNNAQLMAKDRQTTSLILTKDEFISTISDSLSNALKALNIRPKTITKIIEKEIIIHDTTIKTVFVQSSGKDTWLINDSGKCWEWSAVAKLTNDSLNVNRTDFNYHNTTTDIFNWIRPHKFLFFRWGKKEITQTSASECGETVSRTIEVIKK